MKSRIIISVALLCYVATANCAQYYHARQTPMRVDYNFELRNSNLVNEPVYYRFTNDDSPLTAWTLLKGKDKPLTINVTDTLVIWLSAHQDGSNVTKITFAPKLIQGPRSRGPRTCYINAHVTHPSENVVVTVQNVSQSAKRQGQTMTAHRLSLDRNLTPQELARIVSKPAAEPEPAPATHTATPEEEVYRTSAKR